MRKRWSVSIVLTLLLFVLYYGYILVVAYGKPILAVKVGTYATLGIVFGAVTIVGSWLLTVVYVMWANTKLRSRSELDQERSHLGARMQTSLGQANWISIVFFAVFVCITLLITYWAAKRTKSTAEYYAAGRSVTGFQNGLALAGDYM